MDRGLTWLRYNAAAGLLSVNVHVQPNARNNAISGMHGDALKIRIAAPATDSKANTALVAFLSKKLGIPKSAIAIRHGASGRRKVLEISGDPGLAAKLEALALDRPTIHDPRSTPST